MAKFKPGDVGNPEGGKRANKHYQLKELLMKSVPDAVRVIEESLHEKNNKTWAAKEVLDRVYGKAPQAVSLTGEVAINLVVGNKAIDKR